MDFEIYHAALKPHFDLQLATPGEVDLNPRTFLEFNGEEMIFHPPTLISMSLPVSMRSFKTDVSRWILCKRQHCQHQSQPYDKDVQKDRDVPESYMHSFAILDVDMAQVLEGWMEDRR